eukprot:8746743-Ditylum_brightwellii.AAC.1
MSESNLFKLLDLDFRITDDKRRIDADAIIKEAEKISQDLIDAFSSPVIVKPKCALCSHVTTKHQFDRAAALHLVLHDAPDENIDVSKDVVAFLLRKCTWAAMERENKDKTPLHISCKNGTPLDVLSLLLNSWPDAVKEKDSDGRAPLHLTCRFGASLDVVSALLSS